MPLTDVAVRTAKPTGEKPVKKSDGHGLYLQINPNGTKLWRMAYRFGGKQKLLSFGAYPDVTLSEARAKRENARALLRENTDPAVDKKLKQIEREISTGNTFEAVVKEFLDKQVREGRSDATIAKNTWLLKTLAADLASRPIAEIKPIEILSVLQRVEKSGRAESAHRLRGLIGTVFRYAIATLRCEVDPTYSLKGSLARHVSVSHPAIVDPKKFGKLLVAIDEYDGWPTLTAALKIQALCFQRPAETRSMEWSEIDLEGAIWKIPASKMKMREEHEVPLSRQALEVLKDIRKLTGDAKLVFPSIRSNDRPLSENAMNAALRRMGYTKEEHCAHGFRSSASTILNSSGFDGEIIELQLAHLTGDEVRRIYNRSKYWPARVALMQDWADLCDRLKTA